MSLPEENTQRSFFDVPVLVGKLFDEKDHYRIFREKILPALQKKREQLCALYCEDNGRPAIEPVVLAGTTLLQFMEKVPDRKAADNVKLHLGWKYALDLEVDAPGFHATSLVIFRNRLLEGAKERIGFEAIFDVLREEGLVKKRTKQRLDSTHVLGCVSKMSRLEVVRETMRLLLEYINKNGNVETIEGWEILKERYLESEVQWHKASKETLKHKMKQAGHDAWMLIEWLDCQNIKLRESHKAVLLKRVFHEQFEVIDGDIVSRARESSGTVQNPHDPDAQWSTKDEAKKKQWVGYKVQVSETVADDGERKKKGEPTEQFIVDVTTTKAITSDYEGMEKVREAEAAQGQELPYERYVDAGYVSDDTLAQAHEEGVKLIGPARPSGNPKGCSFIVEDFDVDVGNRKAVCPAGHENTQCSRLENQKTGEVAYRFEWSNKCDSCPLKNKCTTSKSGRKMLVVGEHHEHLQKRRREMKTEEFKKQMHRRNAIEGTISELARSGLRHTRYRGLVKTSLANYFIGAACNVKRWIRLIQWQDCGAT